MNLTLSPQLRLIVLLGIAAMVLALGGMLFLLRASAASEDSTPAPVVHRPGATKASVAPRTPAKAVTKVKTKAKTRAKAQAAATPTRPATPTKPKAVTPTEPAAKAPAKPAPIARHGLPLSVALALRAHSVVVVAMVVPGADLDDMALAEAQAGAKAAGAGFLSVNVLKNAVGRPLAEKLGVIQTPAIVVYRRPAKVFVRFEGFADRDTVAQAATTARTGR